MVTCVTCGNFTRKTRQCSVYRDGKGEPITLKPSEIHRQMSCPRYTPKYGKVVEVKT